MTTTIPAPAIADAVVRLRAAGCVFAEDEAAVLSDSAADEAALRDLVRRRADGEPLEQVVGHADFCGVRVRLRRGVFVPRVRSELLVRLSTEAAREATGQAAMGHVAGKAAGRPAGETVRKTAGKAIVVDLCCGSGALGMAVAHRLPDIILHAADVDPAAVACARDNLGNNVYQGDLFEPLPRHLRRRISVLMANVPYVASRHIPLLPAEARDHEPRTALDGGDDGLDVFRTVVAEAADWLAPGGVLLSEITETQIAPALAAIQAAGMDGDTVHDEDLEATVVRARRQR